MKMKKFGGEVDDKYIDFLNETHTGVALKEALEAYYESLGMKGVVVELEKEFRKPEGSIIEGLPRICEHLDGEECLSESPCDACRFESKREAMSLVYRINLRPLWKNNTPLAFSKMLEEVITILSVETGNQVWWEETSKGLKFQLADSCMQIGTIIALQAIGHNNGGYMLGISRVL